MKVKILDILGEPIVKGGQESFILNMYNNMDKDKIQIDVLTPFTCENDDFKDNIEENGGKVFVGNNDFYANRKKAFNKCVNEFLEKNHYNTVHIQSGSIYAIMMGSKIASKHGIKNIIIHSHCGGFPNLKYKIIKRISKFYMMKYPTEYWACSKLAAEWKFPKEIIEEKKYKILKNAIDTSKLYFLEETRNKARKNLDLKDDNFVVGHIGRFSIQKNHDFLIDIFKEIHDQNNKAVLLLIGTGELEEKIKNKVIELGLKNCVRFLGIRNDINDLLNAMDVFLLPSFFEGLPVVGVEAQATGLQVITSDKVTQELPIEELAEYYSLEMKPEIWANKILKKCINNNRKDRKQDIKNAGYDVKDAALLMQNYYINLDRNKE